MQSENVGTVEAKIITIIVPQGSLSIEAPTVWGSHMQGVEIACGADFGLGFRVAKG